MVWYCKSRLQEHQPSGIPSRLPASGILQNSTDWTSWQHLSCSNYQALSNGEQRTLQAEGIGGCHGDWRNVFFFRKHNSGRLVLKDKTFIVKPWAGISPIISDYFIIFDFIIFFHQILPSKGVVFPVCAFTSQVSSLGMIQASPQPRADKER